MGFARLVAAARQAAASAAARLDCGAQARQENLPQGRAGSLSRHRGAAGVLHDSD